jgi:hypothetical protein
VTTGRTNQAGHSARLLWIPLRFPSRIGVLFCLTVALATAGCGEESTKVFPALTQVMLPVPLRAGSPVRVLGWGLAGAALRLDAGADPVVLELSLTAVGADGVEVAEGLVPADLDWTEGRVVDRACLTEAGGLAPCLPVATVWTREVPAVSVHWGGGEIRFGDPVTLTSGGLLLPGEGTVTLQSVPTTGGAVSEAFVVMTDLDAGRDLGRVEATPAWLGLTPGARSLRLRLVQETATQSRVGPWSEPVAVDVMAAELTGDEKAELRRGWLAPLTVRGVPSGGWQVRLTGKWQTDGKEVAAWTDATARLLDGRVWAGQPAAWLDSPWFMSQIKPLAATSSPATALHGEARLVLRSGYETWWGPAVPVLWPVRPTVQVVEIELGDAFAVGLGRLGLGNHVAEVRQRVIARLASHFAGLSVVVATQRPAGAVEVLQLAVLDRDPNGFDLLGSDNSVGKDVGNLTLDERLTGYGAAAAVAGQTAYGGVFLNGLFLFSAQLHPGEGQATKDFDAIFGPWSPRLGGKPAPTGQVPDLAIETAARLIAHTAAHEIGHALGLPAGTDAFHHPEDHPGWIMDEGTARPFAERAGLPGAAPAVWGPVDDAYLQAILPP